MFVEKVKVKVVVVFIAAEKSDADNDGR